MNIVVETKTNADNRVQGHTEVQCIVLNENSVTTSIEE